MTVDSTATACASSRQAEAARGCADGGSVKSRSARQRYPEPVVSRRSAAAGSRRSGRDPRRRSERAHPHRVAMRRRDRASPCGNSMSVQRRCRCRPSAGRRAGSGCGATTACARRGAGKQQRESLGMFGAEREVPVLRRLAPGRARRQWRAFGVLPIQHAFIDLGGQPRPAGTRPVGQRRCQDTVSSRSPCPG